MISIQTLRKIDTNNTTHLTNDELEAIRDCLYGMGQLIFDDWYKQKFSSKSPRGLLTNIAEDTTI